jgi:hypothetical protein
MAKAIEVKKSNATPPAAGNKPKKTPGVKLPFGKKFATIALKTRQRLEKAFKKIASADNAELVEAKAQLSTAVAALDVVAIKLNALPDAFALKGAKAEGGGKVEVGSVVSIREKRKAEYDGLIEEAELATLTVLAVKGAKVVLKTASGNKLMMPKAHVQAKKAA